MQPLTFGPCAGWLHPACGTRGVVLCAAHGFEEFGARRGWRMLADRLAAAGLPTLRFDYPGAADSLGGEQDPERLAAWRASIEGAIQALRDRTGVREVYLVGLRLGALLAADVAARSGGVSGIALLAPPLSGRAYGRELAALSALMAPPGTSAAVPDEPLDGIETAGFVLARTTLEELKGLDWRKLPAAPAPRVAVMTDDQPAAFATALRSLGVEPDLLPFPGRADLVRDPTTSVVPEAAWDALAAWLAKGAAPAVEGAAVAPLAPPALLAGPGWTEELATFGPSSGLVGVLNHPAGAPAGGPVLLVLNAGGNSHVGWARQTVDLCRRLAARGAASLRMDMLGFGDAAEPSDDRPRRVYADQSHADVAAAIDWLKARGYGSVTVAGQCSAAYRAFHSAMADPRIDAVVMLNNQIFAWRDGMSLDAAMRDSFRATSFYLSRAGDGATWRRLFGGDIKAAGIAAELARRGVRSLANRMAQAAKRGESLEQARNPVRRAFGALSARGARVLLVYSEDDGGRDELARHMGPNGRDAARLPGLSLRIIAGADHNLTTRRARDAFARCVEEFLLGSEDALARRSAAR
ncbi:alpha/beta fold hydrolase [Alsobacter sp. KACC 23698]|uniref:Alpha/beta fold hydrolase n=1 Tax=Alsobacter sp. KACC 23698 TaxID=3149229 RepID=A0AAU7JGM1_9HYPH